MIFNILFVIIMFFLIICIILINKLNKINKINISLDKDCEINFISFKNVDFLKNLKTCDKTIYIDKLMPKHINLDLYEKKGWGLKTLKNIKKGEIIYDYPIEKSRKNIYIISRIGEKYIDPEIHYSDITKLYNIFSYWDVFINHDDKPNAYYKDKIIIKNKKMYCRLYALRNISKNEELLIDYNSIEKNNWLYNCFIDFIKTTFYI